MTPLVLAKQKIVAATSRWVVLALLTKQHQCALPHAPVTLTATTAPALRVNVQESYQTVHHAQITVSACPTIVAMGSVVMVLAATAVAQLMIAHPSTPVPRSVIHRRLVKELRAKRSAVTLSAVLTPSPMIAVVERPMRRIVGAILTSCAMPLAIKHRQFAPRPVPVTRSVKRAVTVSQAVVPVT